MGAPLSCAKTITPLKLPLPRAASTTHPAGASTSRKILKQEVRTQESSSTEYAEAIRRRNFSEAARLIDAASEDERQKPEVRYARSLVALELDDVDTALRVIDRLNVDFPEFSPEVERTQIAAAKKSLDLTLLSHFLGKSEEPEDLLVLSEAHAANDSSQKARGIATSLIASLLKSKRRDRKLLEARAHLILARALEKEGDKVSAAKEYHWLATEGATLEFQLLDGKDPQAEGFDSKLDVLNTKVTLTAQERLKRAQMFSEAGLVERTQGELSKLEALSKSSFSESEHEAALAWAFYNSRSDYLRASELFKKAADRGGPKKKEYLYYEAKALARSHQDADAIGKYEALSSLGGEYADHAAFQAARLRFIEGNWGQATRDYKNYLKKYGSNGRHRDAALYDLPVARLAAKDFGPAEKEFEELRRQNDDPQIRARFAQLQAVALLGLGKEAEAELLFRKVIADRPLSYPALLSAARLRSMNKAVPPAIAQSEAKKTTLTAPLSLELPDKVRRLSRVGLDIEAENSLRSQEAKIRATQGPRAGEALCQLYGQLESAMRRYQVAQTAASWDTLKKAPGPESEWQWDCIYPTPYRKIVAAEATERRVPLPFVYGIMRQESAFRPTVVSPANAVGLMQIIPPTASRIAEELGANYRADLMRAPAINISYGTYYLRRLLDIFENHLELAAASYNAGPHAVTRWLRAGDALPLDVFVARIPYEETRNYVYRVMGNYARYAFRNGEFSMPDLTLQLPTGLRADDSSY